MSPSHPSYFIAAPTLAMFSEKTLLSMFKLLFSEFKAKIAPPSLFASFPINLHSLTYKEVDSTKIAPPFYVALFFSKVQLLKKTKGEFVEWIAPPLRPSFY